MESWQAETRQLISPVKSFNWGVGQIFYSLIFQKNSNHFWHYTVETSILKCRADSFLRQTACSKLHRNKPVLLSGQLRNNAQRKYMELDKSIHTNDHHNLCQCFGGKMPSDTAECCGHVVRWCGINCITDMFKKQEKGQTHPRTCAPLSVNGAC